MRLNITCASHCAFVRVLPDACSPFYKQPLLIGGDDGPPTIDFLEESSLSHALACCDWRSSVTHAAESSSWFRATAFVGYSVTFCHCLTVRSLQILESAWKRWIWLTVGLLSLWMASFPVRWCMILLRYLLILRH